MLLVALPCLFAAPGKTDPSVPPEVKVDPTYAALRSVTPAKTVFLENVVLEREGGTFTFRKGTLTLATPVEGRNVVAVFLGDGNFVLTPAQPLEKNYLAMLTGKPGLTEEFNKVVFASTDFSLARLMQGTKEIALEPRAAEALSSWRDRVRHHTENPRSYMEAMLAYDEIENVDAELLGDLTSERHPAAMRAYIYGKKYGDLRFFINRHGALASLLAPEEVALVNLDPGANEEAILYLSHYQHELKNNTATSNQDQRRFAPEHYSIETTIGGGEKINATAKIKVKAIAGGDRVIRLGLFPTLRVSRMLANGQDIAFIQEDRKRDGMLYAVLSKALTKDQSVDLTIDYAGDKIIRNEGGGSYSVGARTNWYPSLNSFRDQATYDLTFRVAKKFTLVSVGQLESSKVEDKATVTHWISKVPLAVAGFNFGEYKAKKLVDDRTSYQIEGLANTEMPYFLKDTAVGHASPSVLIDKTLGEAQNSIRLYSDWFGNAPYGRIAITQQPEMNFGQSWPGLVYLPIIAYLDSTQRWELMGNHKSVNDFIQEVTAHEVAHQWWGHMVGWASFHDQWLSEGFADFSAGVFVQATQGKSDNFMKFLEKSRDHILEKNNFGFCANDAGPLWMGTRLSHNRARSAYSSLVYPKGGYVLHMLRMMMWDNQTGDTRFKNMMKEFVAAHLYKPASTEDFQAMVEKHMIPVMNVEGNGKMDWFFRNWVYGSDIPRYSVKYDVAPKDEKFVLTATLTQANVSDDFKMPVPIYAEFDTGLVRIGFLKMAGSSSSQPFNVILPAKPKRVLANARYDVLAYKN